MANSDRKRAREVDDDGDTYGPLTKQLKSSPGNLPVSPRDFPWLRSGRSFAHPLVIEAATIQVASLADFTLDHDAVSDHGGRSTASSQTTVTESSPPTTPRPLFLRGAHDAETWSSQSTTTEPSTPPTQGFPVWASSAGSNAGAPRTSQYISSSQASTAEAPWRPIGTSKDELRALGIDAAKILAWFAVCYDSDGYDTDALVCLAKTAPLSPARSIASSRVLFSWVTLTSTRQKTSGFRKNGPRTSCSSRITLTRTSGNFRQSPQVLMQGPAVGASRDATS
ncbi:hypothetical protein V7S43_018545 [Phytophthora oleae]|uniref:Uncharacterized protein n=1 Tax=Phytophthora oleae TaxID=2107226 RepID=A0ABD3EQC9_9STRA